MTAVHMECGLASEMLCKLLIFNQYGTGNVYYGSEDLVGCIDMKISAALKFRKGR